MSSVVLVEDDAPTRRRLAQAIHLQPSLELVASVGTVRDGLTAVRKFKPRILLTDLGLPDGSGLELIKATTGESVLCDVMVISVFNDEYHVIEALHAGAKGYLLKDSDLATIGNDIQMMLDGGSPISPKVARYLLRMFSLPMGRDLREQEDTSELTVRENEILRLIAQGYRRAEIGELLHISINTVGTHIRKIYSKLSIHTNVEAIQEAIRLGLL